MKTLRNLFGLLALLAVAGCQAALAGPAQSVVMVAPAGQAAPAGGQAGSAALPTLEPAADLSADYAAFPGLYWTGEQIATGGEHSVRVLSARPCAELLDLLSAGEWRATERLDSPPGQFRFPSLLLLERGEAVAMARADSLDPVTSTVTAEAAPLAIGEQCRAQVSQMSPQPVEAGGAETAQGDARIYPYLGGCRTFTAGSQVVLDVVLMYEGPGDFRALLVMALPAPVSLGEHALEAEGLSLTIFRSEQRYFEFMGEGYAQIRAGLEMKPQALAAARSFSAASLTPGTLTVTGTAPLEGQIDLTHLADEAGATQTFRAGFQCNG